MIFGEYKYMVIVYCSPNTNIRITKMFDDTFLRVTLPCMVNLISTLINYKTSSWTVFCKGKRIDDREIGIARAPPRKSTELPRTDRPPVAHDISLPTCTTAAEYYLRSLTHPYVVITYLLTITVRRYVLYIQF